MQKIWGDILLEGCLPWWIYTIFQAPLCNESTSYTNSCWFFELSYCDKSKSLFNSIYQPTMSATIITHFIVHRKSDLYSTVPFKTSFRSSTSFFDQRFFLELPWESHFRILKVFLFLSQTAKIIFLFHNLQEIDESK